MEWTHHWRQVRHCSAPPTSLITCCYNNGTQNLASTHMQFFPSFFSFSKVYFLFIHSLLWPALQLTVCEYIAIHQYIRCNTVHWYSKTHLAALILTLHTILCGSVLLLHLSLEASCGATDPVFHNLTTEEYPSLSKMVWAKSCYNMAESSCANTWFQTSALKFTVILQFALHVGQVVILSMS